MRDAYLIGAGQTAFGAFPDESYRSLFAEAYDHAIDSIGDGFDPTMIDEAVVATLGVGGRQLGLPGPAVTEHVGLRHVPCTRVENACAAGGYAVRNAVQAVGSGMADVVLAGGIEVMTDMSSDVTKYWLGVSGETEWERLTGTTFSGVYAQMASAYLEATPATHDHLSKVAVKNHANGAENPDAHLGFGCSIDDARGAPTVASPLNLYDCCPTSDGAAAAVIAAEEVAREVPGDPIRIAGVGAASGRVGLFQRDTYTSIPATVEAGRRACEMAGIDPTAVDFAELHDCFTIAELLAYEDLGFCDRGEGFRLIEEGVTALDGDLPVNPSGGLKSKGHPIGATGTGQIAEVFKQFRERAGDRQIENARRALTHNVGGSGGAVVVHILEREVAA